MFDFTFRNPTKIIFGAGKCRLGLFELRTVKTSASQKETALVIHNGHRITHRTRCPFFGSFLWANKEMNILNSCRISPDEPI